MGRTRFAVAFVITFLFATGTAQAFCAAPPPNLCSAYFQADVVVLGKVLDEHRGADWIRYEVEAKTVFKGEPARRLSLYTGNDSGRLNLDVGSEHVLFARRGNNRLLVGCDEQALSDADPAMVSSDIKKLRTQRTEVATVEGQTVSASDFSLPLPGVIVTAAGPAGTFRATSDKDGRFSMRVPPGKYRVSVDPSVARQTLYSVAYTDPDSVHLAPGQCAQLQYQGVPH